MHFPARNSVTKSQAESLAIKEPRYELTILRTTDLASPWYKTLRRHNAVWTTRRDNFGVSKVTGSRLNNKKTTTVNKYIVSYIILMSYLSNIPPCFCTAAKILEATLRGGSRSRTHYWNGCWLDKHHLSALWLAYWSSGRSTGRQRVPCVEYEAGPIPVGVTQICFDVGRALLFLSPRISVTATFDCSVS